MLSPECNPGLKHVVISKSPMGIEFDSSLENIACTTNVAKSDSNDEVPIGSRLIAIDNVDVRALPLNDIIGILGTLAGIQKTLTFDLDYHHHATSASPPTSVSNIASDIAEQASPAVAKSSVRFVGVESAEDAPTTKSSRMRPPPLQINPIVPPSALPALSIRTADAISATAQVGLSSIKQEPALNSSTFMITMAAWSGSRSSRHLVVDKLNKCLHIMPPNPSSPRSAKTSVIAFSDISALDTGKASPPSPSKKGLFRSLSSSKDITESYTVVISATKASKSSGRKKTKVWQFDMLSSAERDELEAILLK
ncbi:hypothetical protein PRIC2_012823 [Phytophthora ramorum]